MGSIIEDFPVVQSSCDAVNCSGHGECHNGSCFCEIRFSGSSCSGINLNYHLALSITYLVVALVSLIQLVTSMVMSIVNGHKGESSNSKHKTTSVSSSSDEQAAPVGENVIAGSSMDMRQGPQRTNLKGMISQSAFKEALTPTTPKAIYAVVFLASSMRAAYFAASATLSGDWLLKSLLSAYYPLLLTGSSLIVCFWAEIFHLRDKRIVSYKYLSHRFLGKSFLGFLSFNVITYSLLLAQLLLVLSNSAHPEEKSYYLHIFNGAYAFLILIVVTFFLIYGVEVYFKLRIEDYLKTRKSKGGISKDVPGPSPSSPLTHPPQESKFRVNHSQLNQSRLGLVSQASMLIVTVIFILSDVLGEFWKNKIPVEGRNYHNIIFALVEIGVCVWFPCVLWNVHRPEQLWVLNPKKIMEGSRKVPATPEPYNPIEAASPNGGDGEEEDSEETESDVSESSQVGCYFCYDPERTDAGSLIQPCACRGDVGSVHHECLKKWLVQQAGQLESKDEGEWAGLSSKTPKRSPTLPEISCSICKTPYSVVRPSLLRRGRREDNEGAFTFNSSPLTSCSSISSQHWLKLSLLLSLISGIFMFTFALCHVLPAPPYKVLVVGIAIILLYLILKFLGQNTLSAYQQAKVSSLTILSLRRRASSDEENGEDGERAAEEELLGVASTHSKGQEQLETLNASDLVKLSPPGKGQSKGKSPKIVSTHGGGSGGGGGKKGVSFRDSSLGRKSQNVKNI